MGECGQPAAKKPRAVGRVSAAQSDVIIKERRVSVVTPVFNGEAFVSRLLDSVLGQTYPDIEMILVDDGSTDGTVRTAQTYIPKFQEKGYSLSIIPARHKNASAAINAGLCHVSGEYLVWPDADDELHPDSIGARVRFLERHPEYRCVRSVMEYVLEETGEDIDAGEKLGDLSREALFWDIIEGRSFVCCGCYMLRTREFFQIYPDRRIPEYEVGQNFQMLLPFLFHYQCPTIPEKLYRVYIRTDSHSRKKRSEDEDRFRVEQFGALLREILWICGIEKTPEAVNRIKLWSARQNRQLARRHRHMLEFYKYTLLTIYFGQLQRLYAAISDGGLLGITGSGAR